MNLDFGAWELGIAVAGGLILFALRGIGGSIWGGIRTTRRRYYERRLKEAQALKGAAATVQLHMIKHVVGVLSAIAILIIDVTAEVTFPETKDPHAVAVSVLIPLVVQAFAALTFGASYAWIVINWFDFQFHWRAFFDNEKLEAELRTKLARVSPQPIAPGERRN